eukprot:4745559-Alexandrium_andersonii.AAC.1
MAQTRLQARGQAITAICADGPSCPPSERDHTFGRHRGSLGQLKRTGVGGPAGERTQAKQTGGRRHRATVP